MDAAPLTDPGEDREGTLMGPGIPRAAPALQPIWNQSSGFRHGLFSPGCKSCPVLLLMPRGLSSPLHPWAAGEQGQGSEAISNVQRHHSFYSGLRMFAAFLFHSFPSF